ncbi:DUF6705 family protein [Chryseobacterium cucumeris]|uniref:DUF6705 family protein n=1 Tax=Chryseobacterium cucumeris TaxID=1813611 RepID=UPI00320A0C01
MKNTFLLILLTIAITCKAQTYPLRNYIDLPENSYEKDTNNEFSLYIGTWKGNWSNKIIYVSLSKITNKYDDTFKYYRDFLIARFKVTDLNGNILFDNTNLPDDKTKIKGIGFRKIDDKYSLIYIDRDLCMRSGTILLNFTDTTKTQLQWKYSQDENWISKDCFYDGWAQADVPQPLPNNIIMIKQ